MMSGRSGSTIKIRRNTAQGVVPSINDLVDGELALNIYDGKLFFKKTVGNTKSIVALQQISAGTGVSLSTDGVVSIGQTVATTANPTFAGATLNGITAIKQSGIGAQNTLTVAGASPGSVFAVGVSDTATDGIKLQSLTSNLANPAKLTISGSSVILKAGTKELTFNDSGNLQLPANGDIVDSNNVSVLKFPSVNQITFNNPITDSNLYDPDINPSGNFYTTATATNSSNKYITVDDSSGFTVDNPVI
jgi:hypothetical protein